MYVDVNECELNPKCDQKCINEYGRYSCACLEGFELQPDLHRCKRKAIIFTITNLSTLAYMHISNRRSVLKSGSNYNYLALFGRGVCTSVVEKNISKICYSNWRMQHTDVWPSGILWCVRGEGAVLLSPWLYQWQEWWHSVLRWECSCCPQSPSVGYYEP